MAYLTMALSSHSYAGDTRKMSWGFNTNIHQEDAGKSGLNDTAFRSMIDDLSAQGFHGIIRFMIDPYENFHRQDCSASNACDFSSLDRLRPLLSYAKTKSFAIMIVVPHPSWVTVCSDPTAHDLQWKKRISEAEYEALLAQVYKSISSRIGEYVDYINLYNEPNLRAFDTNQPIPQSSWAGYLKCSSKIFSYSYKYLKKELPNVEILTDIGGLPLPSNERSYSFAKAVLSSVDMIGINLYPGPDPLQVQSLPKRVTQLRHLLDKKLMVTELGICSANDNFSEQSEYLQKYIDVLEASPIEGILVYEYQDDLSRWRRESCSKSYGLVNGTQQKKSAYEHVLTKMTK
jgi:hypothetical protein